MSTKISQLATGTTANSTDKIPIERSGANYYITPAMIQAGSGYTEGARVYIGSAVSIADNTATYVNFDQESFDTASIHSPSTNPSRLTIPVSGIYLISLNVIFAANATGNRWAAIYQNQTFVLGYASIAAFATNTAGLSVNAVQSIAANSYVEARVLQSSTAALDLTAAYFAIMRIGPAT